ncbi:MAG: signal recognition particle protein, partial [Candidatus Portiera sp.]|nr:signal recognition particle protein [Portiera sp.]
MFDSFSDKMKGALDSIRKKARLTEENITPALNEMRVALLEADTSLEVTKSIISNLTSKALGMEAQKLLNPGQMFISLVHKELTEILGGEQQILNIKSQPPATIMLVGMQGAGKTTNLAKIALWLRKTRKKKVLLAGLDISRPAASEQLEILAKQAEIDYYAGKQRQDINALAEDVREYAQLSGYDCLVVDTAGRTQNDPQLMQELKSIHDIIKPVEVLYTMDSMGGQSAAAAAIGFQETLPLTGIIVTKLDAAARGGSVLSAKYLTGLPMKLLSNGEKLTDIMDFNPSAMAESIMGMGNALA